jgi:putative Mn2+ efflux pump MntP
MRTINVIVGFTALLFLGYILLKEGLHKETAKEKMIKTMQPPLPKRFPKWYAVLLGIGCWSFALYFAIKFFLGLI